MKNIYALLKLIQHETNACDVDISLSTEFDEETSESVDYIYISVSFVFNEEIKSMVYEVCRQEDVASVNMNAVLQNIKFELDVATKTCQTTSHIIH